MLARCGRSARKPRWDFGYWAQQNVAYVALLFQFLSSPERPYKPEPKWNWFTDG